MPIDNPELLYEAIEGHLREHLGDMRADSLLWHFHDNISLASPEDIKHLHKTVRGWLPDTPTRLSVYALAAAARPLLSMPAANNIRTLFEANCYVLERENREQKVHVAASLLGAVLPVTDQLRYTYGPIAIDEEPCLYWPVDDTCLTYVDSMVTGQDLKIHERRQLNGLLIQYINLRALHQVKGDARKLDPKNKQWLRLRDISASRLGRAEISVPNPIRRTDNVTRIAFGSRPKSVS